MASSPMLSVMTTKTVNCARCGASLVVLLDFDKYAQELAAQQGKPVSYVCPTCFREETS